MDYIYLLIIANTSLIVTLFCIFALCNKLNKYIDDKVNYQYLLESPQNYHFNTKFLNHIDDNNIIVKTIDEFCRKYNVYSNGCIVSLSGGVDSMVLFAILLQLRKKHYFPIFTASIDYNLREESNDESKFIQKYVSMFRIKSYVSYVENVSRKKEDTTCKRSEFEEESRNVRFNTYKDIMAENNLTQCGVFVAHHQDDIIENIFTNSMRGGNLLDLEVMKDTSIIHDVNIFRPLLSYKKQVIYNFAHLYGIPYFLDTTPLWSKRGKMRNEIFPLLDNVFGVDWRNKLKLLGDQSNKWGNYVNNIITIPYFNSITFGKYGFIMPIKEETIMFHVMVMAMHHISENMIRNKSQKLLIDKINNKYYNKKITLDTGKYAIIINEGKELAIFNLDKIKSAKEFGIYAVKDHNIALINGRVHI